MNNAASPWRPLQPDHTRVVLVRHGETAWNAEKRFQGHTDIALNLRGVQQAKRLANAMQALPYDHCVSSDLQRAHHTAMAITGAAKPIQLDPNLRERNYGHFSGMTGDEMRAHCPQEFAGLMQRDPESPLRHGESLLSFYQRVIDAFTSHLQAHLGQTVLLVAHGGVLDCIYRHCTDEPLHTPRQWALPNCAINIIDRSPQGDFEVVTWAHTAHLSDDPNTPSLDEVDGRIA